MLVQVFDIRPATIADTQSIDQVYKAAIDGKSPHELLWNDLISTATLIVAVTNANVVGFGAVDLASMEQLKWLYVLPEIQGQGIGSALLEHLESIARNAGLQSMRLHSATNAASFYRRHGYYDYDQKDEVEHDHDGVPMTKNLIL
jgi:ribosomal protein S18 acetylase RimI-like enzyme